MLPGSLKLTCRAQPVADSQPWTVGATQRYCYVETALERENLSAKTVTLKSLCWFVRRYREMSPE